MNVVFGAVGESGDGVTEGAADADSVVFVADGHRTAGGGGVALPVSGGDIVGVSGRAVGPVSRGGAPANRVVADEFIGGGVPGYAEFFGARGDRHPGRRGRGRGHGDFHAIGFRGGAVDGGYYEGDRDRHGQDIVGACVDVVGTTETLSIFFTSISAPLNSFGDPHAAAVRGRDRGFVGENPRGEFREERQIRSVFRAAEPAGAEIVKFRAAFINLRRRALRRAQQKRRRQNAQRANEEKISEGFHGVKTS